MPRKWRDMIRTSPSDVEIGDAFAIKIVAVVYPPDREGCRAHWCAYRGRSEWTDDQVVQMGDQLLEEHARSVFYVLDRSGLPYYD